MTSVRTFFVPGKIVLSESRNARITDLVRQTGNYVGIRKVIKVSSHVATAEQSRPDIATMIRRIRVRPASKVRMQTHAAVNNEATT